MKLVKKYKVSFAGPLGGYSETIFGSRHIVLPTEEAAVKYAEGLMRENEANTGGFGRDPIPMWSEICIEPVQTIIQK